MLVSAGMVGAAGQGKEEAERNSQFKRISGEDWQHT
jgi:hypothetical protein